MPSSFPVPVKPVEVTSNVRSPSGLVGVSVPSTSTATVARLTVNTTVPVRRRLPSPFGAAVNSPVVALTFVHPLLRTAVASTLGPAALAATHRRAAVLLAEEGEGGDLLVPHLLGATTTGDGWVVDVLRDAARRATARGAPEVAVRYLERAKAEPPPPALRHPVLLQ